MSEKTVAEITEELNLARITENKLRDTIRLRDQRISDLEKQQEKDNKYFELLVESVSNLSKSKNRY